MDEWSYSGLICLICLSVKVFQDIFVPSYKSEIDLINLFPLTLRKHSGVRFLINLILS